MQSAPELSRLQRLNDRLKRRKEIANQCHQIFAAMPEVTTAPTCPGTRHAWYIYPLLLNRERLRQNRATIFQALQVENIGGAYTTGRSTCTPTAGSIWGRDPGSAQPPRPSLSA